MGLEPLTLFSIAHISNHDMIAMRTIANLLCYPSPSCGVALNVEGFHVTVWETRLVCVPHHPPDCIMGN